MATNATLLNRTSCFAGPSTSYASCTHAPKVALSLQRIQRRSAFVGQQVTTGVVSARSQQSPSGDSVVRALSRKDLIAHVAQTAKFNQRDTKIVVDIVFDAIVESVKAGEKVNIAGFGTFEQRSRNARMGRNPKTGEPLHIPAAKLPAFVAGKAFKEAVNGTDVPEAAEEETS